MSAPSRHRGQSHAGPNEPVPALITRPVRVEQPDAGIQDLASASAAINGGFGFETYGDGLREEAERERIADRVQDHNRGCSRYDAERLADHVLRRDQ